MIRWQLVLVPCNYLYLWLSPAFHSDVAKLPSLLPSLRKDELEACTKLSQLVAAATCDGKVVFHKAKLTGVSAAIQQAFKNNWPVLVDKMLECHFDDLQTIDAMKGVRLLDFMKWPIDTAFFELFGDLEVSLSAIATEWSALKHYAAQNIQGITNI